MIRLNVNIQTDFTPKRMAATLPKALALALTETVKNAQEAITGELPDHFTIRGPWWKKTNKFGIKITPAEKTDPTPTAEVGTNADWLELHEGGGTKHRQARAQFRKIASALKTNESFQRLVTGKNLIAIPTKNVKRTKRDIVQRSQKPLRLKNAFAIKTKSGNIMIFNRQRKKDRPVPMYLLRPSAQIKDESAVIKPAVKAIYRRLQPNFEIAVHKVWNPLKKNRKI